MINKSGYLPWLKKFRRYLEVIRRIKSDLKKEGSTFKKDEFKMLLQKQDHLLGHIYKLLLKNDAATEQIRNCMIKWMQNFKDTVTAEQWEELWGKNQNVLQPTV